MVMEYRAKALNYLNDQRRAFINPVDACARWSTATGLNSRKPFVCVRYGSREREGKVNVGPSRKFLAPYSRMFAISIYVYKFIREKTKEE